MAAIFYTLATLKARLVESDKERGATAVEYAIIVALLSIALVTALLLLVPPVQTTIQGVVTLLGG